MADQTVQSESTTTTPSPTIGDLVARCGKMRSKADRGVHGVVEVAIELLEIQELWEALPAEEKPSKPLSWWVVTHVSPKGLAWFETLGKAAKAVGKERWQMLHPDAIPWVHRNVDGHLLQRFFDQVAETFEKFNKRTPLSKNQVKNGHTRLLKALVKGAH